MNFFLGMKVWNHHPNSKFEIQYFKICFSNFNIMLSKDWCLCLLKKLGHEEENIFIPGYYVLNLVLLIRLNTSSPLMISGQIGTKLDCNLKSHYRRSTHEKN